MGIGVKTSAATGKCLKGRIIALTESVATGEKYCRTSQFECQKLLS